MAAMGGDATETFPCFTVRWKYLSFLAKLWACTVFFTITIVITHMRVSVFGIDWKTSYSPLLFQAMPDGDRLPSSGQLQQSELRRRAEGANVELVDSDGQGILQRRRQRWWNERFTFPIALTLPLGTQIANCA